jgi:hypothetical protein
LFSGIVALLLPLIYRVAVEPVFTAFPLLLLASLLSFFALLAAVTHRTLLTLF